MESFLLKIRGALLGGGILNKKGFSHIEVNIRVPPTHGNYPIERFFEEGEGPLKSLKWGQFLLADGLTGSPERRC